MDPDINAPRVQSWNVSVEQQIGADWGSVGRAIWAATRIACGAWSRSIPASSWGWVPARCRACRTPCARPTRNLNQRRVLSLSGENPASAALIGNLDSHAAVGTQNYRGLKLSMQRRAGSGVSLNANYTLSRCFGLEMPPNVPQFGIGFTNPADPDIDRGHCDAGPDPHRQLSRWAYQTPQFEQSRRSRALASNWRVSGIVNARSGSWLTCHHRPRQRVQRPGQSARRSDLRRRVRRRRR